MNIDHHLILIKGEDKTASVSAWRFERQKSLVWITFQNQKEYPYKASCVAFFKDPRIVLTDELLVLKDGEPLTGVEQLQFFDPYCRVVYRGGRNELVSAARIRTVASALRTQKSNDCFAYLKQIARQTGLTVEGQNILANSYERSVLSVRTAYLRHF